MAVACQKPLVGDMRQEGEMDNMTMLGRSMCECGRLGLTFGGSARLAVEKEREICISIHIRTHRC